MKLFFRSHQTAYEGAQRQFQEDCDQEYDQLDASRRDLTTNRGSSIGQANSAYNAPTYEYIDMY